MTSTATVARVVEPTVGDEGSGGRLVVWGLAATAAALAHNRLWATPNLSFFVSITEQLGTRPFADGPEADYLLTNLGLPVLARLTAQTAPHEYARLHLVVLLVGLAACVALAFRRHGYQVARTLVVLLAAAPGVTVVMQWLGQPDALTFPLGVALALVRGRAALVVCGLLLGLTHPEQAVVVVAVAAVVRGATRWHVPPHERSRWRVGAYDLVAMGLGVLAGRAITEIYFRVNDIQILRPRSQFVTLGIDVFVDHHLLAPASLVYLLLGPLWVVVPAIVVARLVRRSRAEANTAERPGTEGHAAESHAAGPDPGRTWWILLGLAVVLLLPVAVTLDETRVYAMVTAPMVAALALQMVRDPATRPLTSAPVVAVALVIVALLPGGFTAGTATWSSAYPTRQMATFLRDGSHPGDLDAWLLTPFRFVIPTAIQN